MNWCGKSRSIRVGRPSVLTKPAHLGGILAGVSVADIARAGHSVVNVPQRFYFSRSENSELLSALDTINTLGMLAGTLTESPMSHEDLKEKVAAAASSSLPISLTIPGLPHENWDLIPTPEGYAYLKHGERYLAFPQGADSFGIMDEFGSAPELIDLEEAGIQQRNLALWRIADGHVVHVLTLRGTYN